jgi:AsmA protein
MTSTWIRRIAIAIGVLVLLLISAAAVLIATFDANRYKTLAIDWMKTERQRTLAIDGPIDLSFFPRLAVKVSKVRLSERARADEFAAIDEAALAVQVLPLLRKQLVIGRVSARGVRASYLRDAKGVRNIDDLVAGGDAGAASPAPQTTGGPALGFDVSAVQFDDLRLRVRDESADLAGEVTLQSFSSGRLADKVESPVSLRAALKLTRPQALSMALEGKTTVALDLARGAVALTGLMLDVQGDGAGVKGLSAALEGTLGWDGNALNAGPLKVALKSGGLGAMSLEPSTLDVKHALFNPRGQRLELDALKLALAGRQGANPFEAALDWPQLAVDANQLKGSALSGRFKLAGPTALAGSFTSAAPSGNFEQLRLPDVTVTLNGSAGPRKIDGKLRTDLLLKIGKGAAAFEKLDLRATLADPGLQPLQLAVAGNAAADAKAASWKLAGALNANRFESAGQATLGGTVPNIRASARFDDLDLNKVLAPDQPSPKTSTPSAAAPADTPVPLDGLKAVNGQFTLSAGALAFRQYTVADAKLDAALDAGTLRVARLAGKAWGGSIEASGSAAAGSQRVAIKLNASGVDVNALLKAVADKDLLEGTGRVTADLNSSGATVGALRSALAGSATLQLRDGAIKGINLARTMRQAKAALSLRQDAVSKASTTEKTDFTELTASAQIAGGVARSDDLDVKSPYLRLGGAGSFDIGRGRIEYTAHATVIASGTGQGAAELEALRGITVPVTLSGPFDAIDWKIEWSRVAAAAVEKKLKDKLTEKLGERLGTMPAGAASAPAKPEDVLKDKLQDKLKGLFK